MRLIDITGQRFGRITVLGIADRSLWKDNRTHWLCECDCGKRRIIRGKDLKSGNTQSCGCLWRDYLTEGQKGENNHQWQGDNVSYISLHKWLARNYPKQNICENCHKEGKTEYANISGEYLRDKSDFKELCRSCHAVEDSFIKNIKGG